MGRQSKSSRRTENIGKGKITPIQIAFIVDCYLSDNHFTDTRSTFRSEASHLLSKSPVNEAPRSLLSLGELLDEYICLKEEKVLMEQEKMKVQNLLRGMQHVMNTYYNANLNLMTTPPILASGYHSAYTSPALISASKPSTTVADSMKFSTPNSIPTTSKRKGSKYVVDASLAAKKFRRHPPTNELPLKGASSMPQATIDDKHNNVLKSSSVQLSDPIDEPNKSPVQGSSIAKCLFNHPIEARVIDSSGPETPRIASSSPTDKSVSQLEIFPTATSSKEATFSRLTSTNHVIISSETIQVTPTKQMAYYSIERNHCVSTSSPVKVNLKRSGKRDQVKGRLNFDASDIPCSSEIPPIPDMISTSESEEGDIFDLDLANLDALGANFSLTELLMCDFDIDGEGIDYSCQEKQDLSPDSFSGSPKDSGNVSIGADQITSQISSTVAEVFSEKNTSLQGPDTVRTVKSVTKRVQIVSPVKSNRSSRD